MLPPWKATFHDLHHQVDELFEELIFRPWAISGQARWRPAVDLHETPEAYLAEIDLPGVAPDAVRILVSEHQVTVVGTRRLAPPDEVMFQKCERRSGTFQRTLELPWAVDPEKATAECRHGAYRIFLPKKRPPEKQDKQSAQAAEAAPYVIQVTIV